MFRHLLQKQQSTIKLSTSSLNFHNFTQTRPTFKSFQTKSTFTNQSSQRTFSSTQQPTSTTPTTSATTTTTSTTTSTSTSTTKPTSNDIQTSNIIPDSEPLPPTWKSPIIFTLDALAAGVIAYGGYQLYLFTTDQPEIVNLMFNQAQQSPFLIENIGTPMKRDWFWMGNYNDVSARIDFGISGPKGYGRVEGKAFRVKDDQWEMIYLYGALPEFANRLTDLLPVHESEVNLMPYIPDPTDPSAAHGLTGAPALPYTPDQLSNDINTQMKQLNQDSPDPTTLLPNPAYNKVYTPFDKGADYVQWEPEPIDDNDDEDKYLQPRDIKLEKEIASEITRQHIKDLEEYNNLTIAPKDVV